MAVSEVAFLADKGKASRFLFFRLFFRLSNPGDSLYYLGEEGDLMMPAPARIADLLDQAFHSAVNCPRLTFTDTDIKQLMQTLDKLAGGEIPKELECSVTQLKDPYRIPAVSLVLLADPALWDKSEAASHLEAIHYDLKLISNTHSPKQMQHKGVDHVIAYGAGAGASLGSLAEERAARKLIAKKSGLVIREHIESGISSANAVYLHSIDPVITDIWGISLTESSKLFALSIYERFLKPDGFHYELYGVDSLDLIASPEGVSISGLAEFQPVQLGCRRAFQVFAGSAKLNGPRNFDAKVEAGELVVIRALDETESEIQVLRGKNDGPKCTLKAYEWARLSAPEQEFASFLERSCTCGTADCDIKHSILGWNLRFLREPQATLKSFIFTAVKGVPPKGHQSTDEPQAVRASEAFRASMYFSALVEGERQSG